MAREITELQRIRQTDVDQTGSSTLIDHGKETLVNRLTAQTEDAIPHLVACTGSNRPRGHEKANPERNEPVLKRLMCGKHAVFA
jgi:hypothetical protein